MLKLLMGLAALLPTAIAEAKVVEPDHAQTGVWVTIHTSAPTRDERGRPLDHDLMKSDAGTLSRAPMAATRGACALRAA